MALCKLGQGITDIRGKMGGVYFSRDFSGLRQCRLPRTVHRRSSAQNKQRNCFTKARTYSTDNRTVSYLIYRCLNNLPFLFDAIVTGNPDPDCRGKYVFADKFLDKDYYRRPDSAYFIFYYPPQDLWYITDLLGGITWYWWYRFKTIEGIYTPGAPVTGNPIVKLELRPPPADYQIPKL